MTDQEFHDRAFELAPFTAREHFMALSPAEQTLKAREILAYCGAYAKEYDTTEEDAFELLREVWKKPVACERYFAEMIREKHEKKEKDISPDYIDSPDFIQAVEDYILPNELGCKTIAGATFTYYCENIAWYYDKDSKKVTPAHIDGKYYTEDGEYSLWFAMDINRDELIERVTYYLEDGSETYGPDVTGKRFC